ncbi:hypothetical protein ACFZBU_19410 [Embleya sp. NPDC008237]|uniref:hypothetical protein n=1 Tax=Embleya sp. NPDC008237 TaxID=3363978 RepID=UPI0036EB8B44
MTDRIGWTRQNSAPASAADPDRQVERLCLPARQPARQEVAGPDADARPLSAHPALLRRLRPRRLWRSWRSWRLSLRFRALHSDGRYPR